eukprot:3755562-Amphidinium_carterae.1
MSSGYEANKLCHRVRVSISRAHHQHLQQRHTSTKDLENLPFIIEEQDPASAKPSLIMGMQPHSIQLRSASHDNTDSGGPTLRL